VFRACPEVVAQKERLTSFGHASVEFVHAHNPIPKVSWNRISCFSIQQSLRVRPAMEAGISDHVWSLEEIINLLCEGLLAKTCASDIGIHFHSHGDRPVYVWRFSQIRPHRVYHRSGGVGGRVGCTLDFKLYQHPKSTSGKTAQTRFAIRSVSHDGPNPTCESKSILPRNRS
jgi:hypothetical protein